MSVLKTDTKLTVSYRSLRCLYKGPSIYDVHTEGGEAQVDACGRGRPGRGFSSMWMFMQKIRVL